MQLEIHQQKAIELLLFKQWIRDYSSSGSHIQFTQENFFNWLHQNELVSKEHLDLQLEELRNKNGTTKEYKLVCENFTTTQQEETFGYLFSTSDSVKRIDEIISDIKRRSNDTNR